MLAKLIGEVERYGDASHQYSLEERYVENADLSILHRRNYAPTDVPQPEAKPLARSEKGVLGNLWDRLANIGEYDLEKTR
jgi:hypothetical protein